MRSFILQPNFEESMKKVGKRNYRDIEKALSKIDNGIKNLLTEDQKEKYNLK